MKEFKEEELEKFKNLDISIKQSFSIGKGGFGSIFPLNFFWNKKREKLKFRKAFVIKKFLNKKMRDYSLNIWDYFKKNNYNTFLTYRKFEENSIIMTSLSNENKFCISVTNNSKKNEDYNYLTQNKISKILNYEKFVNSFFEICEELWENDIYFNQDLFFILGDKTSKTEFEIFLGDFDTVKINLPYNEDKKWENISKYLNNFYDFLKKVLNCSQNEFDDYIIFFNTEFAKRMKKN